VSTEHGTEHAHDNFVQQSLCSYLTVETLPGFVSIRKSSDACPPGACRPPVYINVNHGQRS
jgi:hypothetical protein